LWHVDWSVDGGGEDSLNGRRCLIIGLWGGAPPIARRQSISIQILTESICLQICPNKGLTAKFFQTKGLRVVMDAFALSCFVFSTNSILSSGR
jgi:hypothetical protein